MPIFEYECRACNSSFEELLRSAEREPEVHCPRCGSGEVQRKLSVFAAHQGIPARAELPPACQACGAAPGSCPASRFAE